MNRERYYSDKVPGLRLVWSASALETLMRDPLTFYWQHVQGWASLVPSISLVWGTAWDESMAFYHNARTRFKRPIALEETIEFAIAYAQKSDLEQIAAESGRDAKMRNLSTLIRSIVWYDDLHGDYDLYIPEISQPTTMQVKLPLKTSDGEQYWLMGIFDQIVRERELQHLLVVERKTTTRTINKQYWLQYDPSVQLNTYDYLASKAGGGNDFLETTKGVFIEACQTAVGFSRFDYHTVYRTPEQRHHWERVMLFWVKFAEDLACNDRWTDAQNLATQRWETTMRDIQRRTPSAWDGLLRTKMRKRK